MAVKMFTMTHKEFEKPEDDMYVPLQVGRALSQDLGYLRDDIGENISAMNDCYSELTGVYWVWKNEKAAEYVGICHYRRYLINESGRIFKEAELMDILKEYDVITSKRLQYDYTYYEGYSDAHNINDLIETGKVIKERYPDYYDNFKRLVHARESYFGNIMVCSKPLFDEYAKWLFTILQEVQTRIDISSYDNYHKRVFGFISEFLLLVWVETKGLKAYEGMVGMSAEKQETKEIKEKLAEYFQRKDIQGAKNYFMECYEKRPDVLLEASDTTGELRLSMQLISTCENEQEEHLDTILDSTTEYTDLMNYFKNINSIIKRYMQKKELDMDQVFLHREKVSSVAISIAVMMFCETEEIAFHTLLKIADDVEKQKDIEVAKGLLKRCLCYKEDSQVQERLAKIQSDLSV